jgi:hypothetical protein
MTDYGWIAKRHWQTFRPQGYASLSDLDTAARRAFAWIAISCNRPRTELLSRENLSAASSIILTWL